jgi:heat-inducible transcriptional repressor
MSTPDAVLNSKRNREILADIVRAYVESGEPISSLAISRSHAEPLSPATIRNVMGELEDAGMLYQPHTSAGRVPTILAYRFFAQQAAEKATLSPADRNWIRSELESATTPEEVTERAGHVLAAVSRGLGIVVMPPLARSVLQHVSFVHLADGRVVVVLISPGGGARDKIIRPEREFTQSDLDRTADYLNRHYAGWTLDAIRAELLSKISSERERYGRLLGAALELCDPAVLESDPGREVYVEGVAQFASAPELAAGESLRELLTAIEEKSRLVALLNGCIETPEPVHIQIGVKEISSAGEHLSLITAPYLAREGHGSLGILAPMRMHYERAITAVAYVAQAFSERQGASGNSEGTRRKL